MNSEETGNFKFGCWKKEGKEMSRNSKIVVPESSSSSKLRTTQIYCQMQCRICFRSVMLLGI
jgi:hypothetical protein